MLALALFASGCAPEASSTVIVYRVTSLDGNAPSEEEMMNARSRLDVRLLGAGFDRYDVSRFGDGRLRVVLPERVSGRMEEVRRVLEDPDGLPVQLTEEAE